jgi:hypothetical protein
LCLVPLDSQFELTITPRHTERTPPKNVMMWLVIWYADSNVPPCWDLSQLKSNIVWLQFYECVSM